MSNKMVGTTKTKSVPKGAGRSRGLSSAVAYKFLIKLVTIYIYIYIYTPYIYIHTHIQYLQTNTLSYCQHNDILILYNGASIYF